MATGIFRCVDVPLSTRSLLSCFFLSDWHESFSIQSINSFFLINFLEVEFTYNKLHLFKEGFLNLGTIDILGQLIGWGPPRASRAVSGVLGLHPRCR